MQKIRKRPNHFGFTLIEIMAVVAIISMTTAMSVPHFLRATMDSNESAAQMNLRSLQTVAEDYQFVHGTSPTAATELRDFVKTYYGKQSVISSSSTIPWKFQGYEYDYRVTGPEQWEFIATPQTPGISGNRYFVVSLSGLQEVNSDYAQTNYPGLLPGADSQGGAKAGNK